MDKFTLRLDFSQEEEDALIDLLHNVVIGTPATGRDKSFAREVLDELGANELYGCYSN